MEVIACGFSVTEPNLRHSSSAAGLSQDWTRFLPKNIQVFAPNQIPSAAAATALETSLAGISQSPQIIDLIISATQTPDFNNPGLVSCLMHRLDFKDRPGLELRHLSAGFPVALDAAEALIRQGCAKCVAIVTTDFLSRYFGDWTPGRANSPEANLLRCIYGDGAAACLVMHSDLANKLDISGPCFKILSCKHATLRGEAGYACWLPASSRFPVRLTSADVVAGRHYPELRPEIFSAACIKYFGPAVEHFLDSAGYGAQDVGNLVVHDLLLGLSVEALSCLKFPDAQVHDCFNSCGHLGSAGLLVGLTQVAKQSRNGKVLVAAFSGGPTWGLALLEGC